MKHVTTLTDLNSNVSPEGFLPLRKMIYICGLACGVGPPPNRWFQWMRLICQQRHYFDSCLLRL